MPPLQLQLLLPLAPQAVPYSTLGCRRRAMLRLCSPCCKSQVGKG